MLRFWATFSNRKRILKARIRGIQKALDVRNFHDLIASEEEFQKDYNLLLK